MSNTISIHQSTLQLMIDNMKNALQYSDQMVSDNDYAYSFGYLQSHCNSIISILEAYQN